MLVEIPASRAGGGQGSVDVGPLLQVHIAPGRVLARIAPAWAVVAGGMLAGASVLSVDGLLRLAAAAILADVAWGILRRIITDQPRPVGTNGPIETSLPYGRSDAPLARFAQAIAAGELGAVAPWSGWLGGLVLTAGVSLLLGIPALILSLLVLGVVLLARALAQRGSPPAFCLALLDVALPWSLGAVLVWPGGAGDAKDWLWQTGALAAGFTVLQWGFHRARLSDGRSTLGLWVGQAAVLGTLIVQRQPWATAVSATLFAPPILWSAWCDGAEDALARSLPWWWAAMLAAAVMGR